MSQLSLEATATWLAEWKAFPVLQVQQRFEMGELFGFETRNKYSIEDPQGFQVGFAAEQRKGLWALLARGVFGHWRRFEVHFFSPRRELVMVARHPFRWFFQRLEIELPNGQRLGALQQRWSFLTKKFDVEDTDGRVTLVMRSPFYRIWTFPIRRPGRAEIARIEKRWTGLLAEGFTDKDRFRVRFAEEESAEAITEPLTDAERLLVLGAAIFVDLQYFERRAGR